MTLSIRSFKILPATVRPELGGYVAGPGLQVVGLSYDNSGVSIFKNFSLHSTARLIVLRGASGCGKTTLLKLLSGHLQPTAVISKPSNHCACLVLQEDSLLPWMTGIDNICKFTRVSPQKVREHSMYRLVSNFVDKKAYQMSYGQRRIVELFRAVIHHPPYLYLDEPFNFLDEANIEAVAPFLVELSQTGTNVVLSNHHKEDIEIQRSADVFKFDGKFPLSTIDCVSRLA
ncbi:MAG: ATP-binding cassette domain-containing protein [Candidatus Obscuribacterales bacterium]|nr:ATP-binding cassette domain-containing protein [Candidatus Obscuribacterales bacterium]